MPLLTIAVRPAPEHTDAGVNTQLRICHGLEVVAVSDGQHILGDVVVAPFTRLLERCSEPLDAVAPAVNKRPTWMAFLHAIPAEQLARADPRQDSGDVLSRVVNDVAGWAPRRSPCYHG